METTGTTNNSALFTAMPKSCAVSGCKGARPPAVSLHRIPNRPELRKKWTEALGFEANLHSRVCSRHFLPSDYLGFSIYTDLPHVHRTLKRDAVPSVCLQNEWPQGLHINLESIQCDPLKNPKTIALTARRKAVVQDTNVFKSELFCSNLENVESPTEVIQGISTEEQKHLIKLDPDEISDCQVEDPLALQQEEPREEPILIEDDHEVKFCHKTTEAKGLTFVSDIDVGTSNCLSSATSKVKQDKKRTKPSLGVEKNPYNIVVMRTSPSDRTTIASTKNGWKKVKSINMTDRNDLVNENRRLHIQNKMLLDEIECLKKEKSICPSPVEEISNKLRCDDNASAKSSKRKEESTTKQPEPAIAEKPKEKQPATLLNSISQAKIQKFSGSYRIVELEYFVGALCEMQSNHSRTCENSKMLATAERLSGITGEWTFKCSNCPHTETLTTDDRRSRSNRRRIGGRKLWLDWLQCLDPWGEVKKTFEKMGVPFHYAISPDNLDVVTFKRQLPRALSKP